MPPPTRPLASHHAVLPIGHEPADALKHAGGTPDEPQTHHMHDHLASPNALALAPLLGGGSSSGIDPLREDGPSPGASLGPSDHSSEGETDRLRSLNRVSPQAAPSPPLQPDADMVSSSPLRRSHRQEKEDAEMDRLRGLETGDHQPDEHMRDAYEFMHTPAQMTTSTSAQQPHVPFRSPAAQGHALMRGFSTNHSVVTTDSLSYSEWHHLQHQTYLYAGGSPPQAPHPNHPHHPHASIHPSPLRLNGGGGTNQSYGYNTPIHLASHPGAPTSSSGLSVERMGRGVRRSGGPPGAVGQDEETVSLATGNDLAHACAPNAHHQYAVQTQRRMDVAQHLQQSMSDRSPHQPQQQQAFLQQSTPSPNGQQVTTNTLISPLPLPRQSSHPLMSGAHGSTPGGGGPAAVLPAAPTPTYSTSSMFSTILSNLPNRTWKSKCLDYERLRNHVHKVIHLEQQVQKRVAAEAGGTTITSPHVTPENLQRAQRMFWCIVASEWDKVSNFVVEQEQIVSKSLQEWVEMCQVHQQAAKGQESAQASPESRSPDSQECRLSSAAALHSAGGATPPDAASNPHPLHQSDLAMLDKVSRDVSRSGATSSGSAGSSTPGLAPLLSDATPSSQSGSGGGSDSPPAGRVDEDSSDGENPRKRAKASPGAVGATPATKPEPFTGGAGGMTTSSGSGQSGQSSAGSSNSGAGGAQRAVAKDGAPRAASSPKALARTFTHLLKQLIQQSKGASDSAQSMQATGVQTPADLAASTPSCSDTPVATPLGQSSTPSPNANAPATPGATLYSEADLLLCRKFLSIATLSDYLRQFVFLNYTSLWRLLRKYAVHTHRNHNIQSIWNDLLVGGSASAIFPGKIFSELWHRLGTVSEQIFLQPLDQTKLMPNHGGNGVKRGSLAEVPLMTLAAYGDANPPQVKYEPPLPAGPSAAFDACCVCLDEVACPTRLPCGHRFCLICWLQSPSCGAICPSCKSELRGHEDSEVFMGWMQGLSLLHLQKQQRLRLQEVERGEMMMLQHQLERSRVEQQRHQVTHQRQHSPDLSAPQQRTTSLSDGSRLTQPPHLQVDPNARTHRSMMVGVMGSGTPPVPAYSPSLQRQGSGGTLSAPQSYPHLQHLSGPAAPQAQSQYVSMLLMTSQERQAERARTRLSEGVSSPLTSSATSTSTSGKKRGLATMRGASSLRIVSTPAQAQMQSAEACHTPQSNASLSTHSMVVAPQNDSEYSTLPESHVSLQSSQPLPMPGGGGMMSAPSYGFGTISAAQSTSGREFADPATSVQFSPPPPPATDPPMHAQTSLSMPLPLPLPGSTMPLASPPSAPGLMMGPLIGMYPGGPSGMLAQTSPSPPGAMYPPFLPMPGAQNFVPGLGPVPILPSSLQEDSELGNAAFASKRGHGYSCHHCKTTKPVPELFLCTARTQTSLGSKKCRKKYCTACMKRLYSAEWQTKDYSGLYAGSEGGYGWTCPSCTAACVCAGCERKAQGANAPPKKKKVKLAGAGGKASEPTVKKEQRSRSGKKVSPPPGLRTIAREGSASVSPPPGSSAGSAFNPVPPRSARESTQNSSDDKSARSQTVDGMTWLQGLGTVDQTAAMVDASSAPSVPAGRLLHRSTSGRLGVPPSAPGTAASSLSQIQQLQQLQHQHQYLQSQIQQQQQMQLPAASMGQHPSAGQSPGSPTLDGLIAQLQSQSHDVGSAGYLQARAALEQYLRTTPPAGVSGIGSAGEYRMQQQASPNGFAGPMDLSVSPPAHFQSDLAYLQQRPPPAGAFDAASSLYGTAPPAGFSFVPPAAPSMPGTRPEMWSATAAHLHSGTASAYGGMAMQTTQPPTVTHFAQHQHHQQVYPHSHLTPSSQRAYYQ